MLEARYRWDLGQPVRILRSEDQEFIYSVTVDGFDVVVQMLDDGPASLRDTPDSVALRFVHAIQISVFHVEDDSPPSPLTDANGNRDWSERAAWFGERERAYKPVAARVAAQAWDFFRYRMRSPREWRCPSIGPTGWFDENGEELESGIMKFELQGYETHPSGLLNEILLSHDRGDEFAAALVNVSATPPSIAEAFLADAQLSISSGSYQRAVIEMSIACEVAIKQTLFPPDSISGRAMAALEDANKVRLSLVDEYVKVAGRNVFKESFSTFDNVAHQAFGTMIDCRNDIMHRGKESLSLDRNRVHSWWSASNRLMEWLQSPLKGDA